MSAARARGIAPALLAWHRRHGRHDLPWQRDRDPYRVWLSEVMLQQTQVATVIPYFERFVEELPDVRALAAVSLERVLQLWSGLGYYSRARHLHRCARQVVEAHHGVFPKDAAGLADLPGVGPSTAAAVAAFCHGERAAILDGNVKRVLCRVHGIDRDPGLRDTERDLWTIARAELPERDTGSYTQAIMDLGATVCTRARAACDRCPLASACDARLTGRQHLLPARRARRATPSRAAVLVIAQCGARVWLARRPPRGIWGGLWSLPEIALDEEGARDPSPPSALLDRWLNDRAWVACEARWLPVFEHAFTHFRLRARPVHLRIEMPTDRIEGASGHIWLPLAEVRGAALPRPVKTLLSTLAESAPGGSDRPSLPQELLDQ